MGNLEKAAYFNAAAQVHATLALAAAVGVGMPVYIDGEQAMPPRDSAAWGDVAATRSRPIQTVNLPEPQGR